jgi:hypothetical protein
LGTDVPTIAIATEPFGPAASFGTSSPVVWGVAEAMKLLPPPLTAVALVNTADQVAPEFLLIKMPVACGLPGEVTAA